MCEIRPCSLTLPPQCTHMLVWLSGWVLGRPLGPWPPSVPSEGGSMRWNINGVRFCVRYTTWPAGWHQAHSGSRHRTQTQDALAACTHTRAPSAYTWLWVSKVKFPARLLIWDLLTTLKCLRGNYILIGFFVSVWAYVRGQKADPRSESEGNFYLRHLR